MPSKFSILERIFREMIILWHDEDVKWDPLTLHLAFKVCYHRNIEFRCLISPGLPRSPLQKLRLMIIWSLKLSRVISCEHPLVSHRHKTDTSSQIIFNLKYFSYTIISDAQLLSTLFYCKHIQKAVGFQ